MRMIHESRTFKTNDLFTYSFELDVPFLGIVPIGFHFLSHPLAMLQLQTTLACPKPESPVSPKIFFTSSDGSEYEDDEGSTAQATVTTVLDPHRRSPPPGRRPVLRTIRSTEEEHVLSVHLPGFTPEMVTVSARKDDRLAVVADLWHAEANCESPICCEIRGCGATLNLSVPPEVHICILTCVFLMLSISTSRVDCYVSRSRRKRCIRKSTILSGWHINHSYP